MIHDPSSLLAQVDGRRMRELLLDFANIPSPPGDTAIAAEWYAGCLRAAGAVDVRVIREWPETPSVVAGLPGSRRRPTLQLTGHLDTPPLPYARAYRDGHTVYGRGVASGKAGLIAAAEACRVLAEHGPLPGGGLLFVAHSRHQAPEGAAEDLMHLIARGIVGDAVLITGGEHAVLPVAGLGLGLFRAVFVTADGARHERIHHGPGAPSGADSRASTSIDAAHLFTALLRQRLTGLAGEADPLAGAESIHISRIEGGDRFNRVAASCLVEGNWRWLPGRSAGDVYRELEGFAREASSQCATRVEIALTPVRDAFRLPPNAAIIHSLRAAYHQVCDRDLPEGGTTFAGDASVFLRLAGVPAISHGVDAATAYADVESVSVEEMVRSARVYLCLILRYLSDTTLSTARAAVRAPAIAGDEAGGASSSAEPSAVALPVS